MNDFLDPAAIARLETLPVRARVIVEGALTGLHRARLHGSSVEFSEHKEYAAGDEIRHIDWKVYGKADRYYVKRFEQESELTTYLVLDGSGSMSYRGGGVSKLSYGAHLVAALAYLLIRQRDRVGLSVFGDPALDRYVPPRGRPAHLRDLLAVLEDVAERGGSGEEGPGAALERLAEVARRRRNLVVVVSDLFDRDPRALDVLRHLRARGDDVVVFQVLDRDELELPFDGLTMFRALEGKGRLLAHASSIRRQYRERLDAFLGGVRDSCLAGGIDYHLAATDQPFERTLLDFLVARGGGGSR